MMLLKRFARSRFIRTVAVLVALVIIWQIFLSVRANGRVDPALAAEAAEGQPVRVTVVVGFPPERFHTLFLQSYGRVVGVSGNEVQLRDVRPESVGMLARVSGIESIAPDGAER